MRAGGTRRALDLVRRRHAGRVIREIIRTENIRGAVAEGEAGEKGAGPGKEFNRRATFLRTILTDGVGAFLRSVSQPDSLAILLGPDERDVPHPTSTSSDRRRRAGLHNRGDLGAFMNIGASDPIPAPAAVASIPAQRFVVLDGMRGVAALLVVVMHGETILNAHALDHAYLMVDLFFLISGFVLSASYGDRLAQGGAGRWFLQIRATRLYPLAFIGLVLGLGVTVVRAALGYGVIDAHTGLTFALGAAFLPWLGGGLLAPMNGPIWSLQVEFWANVAYGFAARRLTDARLAWIVGTAAFGLALLGLSNGRIDGGFVNNDPVRHVGSWSFLIGWLRICFSFPLGVLIHRMWRRRPRQAPSHSALGLAAATLAAISLSPTAPWPALDLAIVWVVFPALLLQAANAAPTRLTASVCWIIGRISFGLYAVHAPIFLLARTLCPADAPMAGRALVFVGALACSILLAFIAERWIDAPARRWSKRWTRDRRLAPAIA